MYNNFMMYCNVMTFGWHTRNKRNTWNRFTPIATSTEFVRGVWGDGRQKTGCTAVGELYPPRAHWYNTTERTGDLLSEIDSARIMRETDTRFREIRRWTFDLRFRSVFGMTAKTNERCSRVNSAILIGGDEITPDHKSVRYPIARFIVVLYIISFAFNCITITSRPSSTCKYNFHVL